MRTFIGIKLDANAIEQTEKYLKPFKKISTPIRWVALENVHITLKFIGEFPDKSFPKLEQTILEGVKKLNPGPLDLTLAGCGKFGPRDSLNIFWIGISPNPTLQALYKTIDNSLAQLGIPKEDRPFKPHITVGRNKKEYNFKSLYSLIEEKRDSIICDMHVEHFQVFKSVLKPEGPVYTVLKEIPLVYA